MRRANRGWTALEIAEDLELPPEFLSEGHTRGYYGSIVHNVKAVYQRYLSWYDGNPARLHPHPPVEAGRRYVELAGGAEALLAKARVAYDDGDYRWVAGLVSHLVFAQPEDVAARSLQADALEQLGYQTESSTFRNAYLTGAQELRLGSPEPRETRRRNLVHALTVDQIFDSVGIRLQSENLADRTATINWRFVDVEGEPTEWMMGLENRALHYTAGRHDPDADVTVTMTKRLLGEIMAGVTTFAEAIDAGAIDLDADGQALHTVSGNLETFRSNFAVIEP